MYIIYMDKSLHIFEKWLQFHHLNSSEHLEFCFWKGVIQIISRTQKVYMIVQTARKSRWKRVLLKIVRIEENALIAISTKQCVTCFLIKWFLSYQGKLGCSWFESVFSTVQFLKWFHQCYFIKFVPKFSTSKRLESIHTPFQKHIF